MRTRSITGIQKRKKEMVPTFSFQIKNEHKVASLNLTKESIISVSRITFHESFPKIIHPSTLGIFNTK